MSNGIIATKKIQGWVEPPSGPKIPKEGTMAYAIYIDKLKRLERELDERADNATEIGVIEPVDNSSDSVDKGVLIKSQTISHKDTISNSVTIPLEDTVTKSDIVSKSDTISQLDRVTKIDTISNRDTVTKLATVSLSDTVSISDTVSNITPVKDEPLTISQLDTVSQLESVSISDTVSQPNTVPRLDTVPGPIFQQESNQQTISPLDTVSDLDTVSMSDTASAYDTVSRLDTISVLDTVSHLDTVSPSVTVSNSVAVSHRNIVLNKQDMGQAISIKNNYMKFDKDLFPVLMTLSEIEMKVYLELLRRSYGQIPAMQTCEATNAGIAYFTHVSVGSAMSRAIAGLERRGLIERRFCARTRKERSLFRVFLPSELPGAEPSKTEIVPA